MLPLEAFHLRKREGGELGLVGIYNKEEGRENGGVVEYIVF